jgi:hypothetical protein
VIALLLLVLAQPAGVFEKPDAIKGSKCSEYRVVTDTPYPVEALLEYIYEWGTKGTDLPGVKLHKVLKDTPDDRVVYDQLEQPVVSDRDYALTVVRRSEPDGTCRIRFWTSNELAAAPARRLRSHGATVGQLALRTAGGR